MFFGIHKLAILSGCWSSATAFVKPFARFNPHSIVRYSSSFNNVHNDIPTDKSVEAWDFNQWEYFNNPATCEWLSHKNALGHKKKAEIIAKSTNHTHEAVFDSSLPHMGIEQLNPLCVYTSNVRSMSMGEFFVVGEKGEMILFHTGTVDPSKHTINLAHLREWVAAVKPKSLTIIFYRDWCEKWARRVKVKDENEALSDSQVSERLFGEGNTHSFKSYIVRCGLYTSIKRTALSTPPRWMGW